MSVHMSRYIYMCVGGGGGGGGVGGCVCKTLKVKKQSLLR